MERSPDVALVLLLVLETTAKTEDEDENNDKKELGIRVSEVFFDAFAQPPKSAM